MRADAHCARRAPRKAVNSLSVAIGVSSQCRCDKVPDQCAAMPRAGPAINSRDPMLTRLPLGKHVDNRFAEERGELALTLEQNDGVEDGSPATALVLEQNI